MAARSPEDRFWSHVNKTNGCWVWTGATRSGGYGVIRLGSRSVSAHRFAWEMANGPIPPSILTASGEKTGYFVTHLCGKRRCVRPDHLQLVAPARAEEPVAKVREPEHVLSADWAEAPQPIMPRRASLAQGLEQYLDGHAAFEANVEKFAASLSALREAIQARRAQDSPVRLPSAERARPGNVSVEAV